MTASSSILLPEKFRAIDSWENYVDAVDTIVVEDYIQLLNSLLELRDNQKCERAFLEAFENQIGFYLPLSPFSETQIRRLLGGLPYFYEKSGTRLFLDFLSFIFNVKISMEELYSKQDVNSEIQETITDGNTARNFILSKAPIVKGSVRIMSGSDTFVDNGFGSFTRNSDVSIGDINYTAGVINLTLSQTPTSNQTLTGTYKTHRYQGFFTREDAGTLTRNGGDYYLTNHVNLTVDLDLLSGIDQARMISIFYRIAPAVLVINTVKGFQRITADTIYFSAAPFIKIII